MDDDIQMAIVNIAPGYTEPHGRNGNYIFYKVEGRIYVRTYSIPRNPKTEAQQANRTLFAEAVKHWQKLSPDEKLVYNLEASAKPCSGYNLFISNYMKGINISKITHKQVKGAYAYPPCIIPVNTVCTQLLTGTTPVYLHYVPESINSPPAANGYAA